MFKSDLSEHAKEAEAFLRVIPHRAKRTCFMVELIDSQTTVVDLRRIMEEGMNVCTLRPGFFSEENMKRMIRKLTKASTQVAAKINLEEWPWMFACPLKTRIVLTGILDDDKDFIYLGENKEVLLTNDTTYSDHCTRDIIYVSNSHLAKEAKVGMEINLDEGRVLLECNEIIDKNTIKTVVIKPGNVTHMVQVNFRGAKCLRPDITAHDLEVIEFCKKQSVDALIIYYVSSRSTILKVLDHFKSEENRPFIFAGICDEAGLHNLEEIIMESDAIMLCRNHVEYELPSNAQNRMLAIQKYAIGKCIAAGKPIYICGGVLTYLVHYGVLLQSEIADIKNSILNGVSGFSLKCGPNSNLFIESHLFLKDLCLNLEAHFDKFTFRTLIDKAVKPVNAAEAAVIACVQVAYQTSARLIIVPTVSGQTALALSRYWPSCLVLAVCTNLRTAKRLTAIRDCIPLKCRHHPPGKKFSEIILFRIEFALEYAKRNRWIEHDQPYVTLQRSSDTVAYCDMVRMWDLAQEEVYVCPETGEDYP